MDECAGEEFILRYVKRKMTLAFEVLYLISESTLKKWFMGHIKTRALLDTLPKYNEHNDPANIHQSVA